jgi:hypothetical protein
MSALLIIMLLWFYSAAVMVYADAPHGLAATHRDQLNADLLEFVKT